MRLEPFVFLGIILLVWFLSSLGSWLRQVVEQRPSSLQDSDPPATTVEDPPSPVCAVMPEGATHGVQEGPGAVSRIVATGRRPRPTSGRLRYRNPEVLREGIVIMTVFGSCTAIDPRKEPWLSEGDIVMGVESGRTGTT